MESALKQRLLKLFYGERSQAMTLPALSIEIALKQRLRQYFLWRALSSSDFASTFYEERIQAATSQALSIKSTLKQRLRQHFL